MKTVMTVAGFDPSGGAGVLADIKTIAAFDCYGVAAVTSLTVQNTRKVSDARHQSGAFVSAQIGLLFEDFEISAVKTGLLPTREVIETVVESLSSRKCGVLVVDPVIESTSGFRFLDDEAMEALVTLLFPLASVVTPNAREAALITGVPVLDAEGMARAGRAILESGAGSVVVKGGDLDSEEATDVLIDRKGCTILNGPRIKSPNTHGTGCTFASAMACLLARGVAIGEAAVTTKAYVADSIRHSTGHGVLNHLRKE